MNAEKMAIEEDILGNKIKVTFKSAWGGFNVIKVENLHKNGEHEVLKYVNGFYPLKMTVDKKSDVFDLFEKAAIGFYDGFMCEMEKEFHKGISTWENFIFKETHPYDEIGEVTMKVDGPKTVIENKRYQALTVKNRTWRIWDKQTGECYLGMFVHVLPSHLCTIVFKGKLRKESRMEIEKILGYIDD